MNEKSASTVTKLNTALLTIVIGIGGWSLKTMRELEMNAQAAVYEAKALMSKIESIQADINQMKNNSWSTMHMKIWADALQRNNPPLQVPDPAIIRKDYN